MDLQPMTDLQSGGEELLLVLLTGAGFVPKRQHKPVENVSSLNSHNGCVEIVVIGV